MAYVILKGVKFDDVIEPVVTGATSSVEKLPVTVFLLRGEEKIKKVFKRGRSAVVCSVSVKWIVSQLSKVFIDLDG